MKSYTFTMKATVSFDAGDVVIVSIAGHVSRAMHLCEKTGTLNGVSPRLENQKAKSKDCGGARRKRG
jgi:hypothetical protein